MLVRCHLIVLMLVDLAVVLARKGPHHPRGEQVRKVNPHLMHNEEHMKEDLRDAQLAVDEAQVEQMSDEEKQFYHFKMHDYDNNDLLDGLEILQGANVHESSFHKIDTEQTMTTTTHKSQDSENDLQHLVDIIDEFLQDADKNDDGFLNFKEYLDSMQQSEEAENHESNAIS